MGTATPYGPGGTPDARAAVAPPAVLQDESFLSRLKGQAEMDISLDHVLRMLDSREAEDRTKGWKLAYHLLHGGMTVTARVREELFRRARHHEDDQSLESQACCKALAELAHTMHAADAATQKKLERAVDAKLTQGKPAAAQVIATPSPATLLLPGSLGRGSSKISPAVLADLLGGFPSARRESRHAPGELAVGGGVSVVGVEGVPPRRLRLCAAGRRQGQGRVDGGTARAVPRVCGIRRLANERGALLPSALRRRGVRAAGVARPGLPPRAREHRAGRAAAGALHAPRQDRRRADRLRDHPEVRGAGQRAHGGCRGLARLHVPGDVCRRTLGHPRNARPPPTGNADSCAPLSRETEETLASRHGGTVDGDGQAGSREDPICRPCRSICSTCAWTIWRGTRTTFAWAVPKPRHIVLFHPKGKRPTGDNITSVWLDGQRCRSRRTTKHCTCWRRSAR